MNEEKFNKLTQDKVELTSKVQMNSYGNFQVYFCVLLCLYDDWVNGHYD